MAVPCKISYVGPQILNFILTVVILTGMAGCGNSGPPLYPVSGSVTFEGEPVEKGQISFVPDTNELGGGPAYYFSIVKGKYAGKVTAGPKKVEISASRPTDEFQADEDGSQVPVVDSFIPDRYNEETTLKVEIKPEINKDLDFELN